jgi:hypothetical protein
MNTAYLPTAASRGLAATALSLLIVLTSGCSLIGNAIKDRAGSALGVGNTTTASGLWADVPPVEGATKVEAELGLPVQLMIKTMLSQANSGNDDKIENIQAVIYKTDKPISDITSFYTNELMAAQGWDAKDAPGCGIAGAAKEAGATELQGLSGNFCMFGRSNATTGKATVLMIVVSPGDKEGENSIIYARIDGVSKK